MIHKSMRIIVFLARGAFLLSMSAQAKDLYVAQTAQGSDTGADAANAHSLAWLNTAANWGGGTNQVSPGDIVHLSGTLTSTLSVQGSGTSGNVITFLFGTNAKFS